MSITYEGKPCKNCGTRIKYNSGSTCVHCAKTHYQINKQNMIEYQLVYQKTYRTTIEGRAVAIWNNAKKRAIKKGLLFTITRQNIEDLLRVSEYCSVTGDKLDFVSEIKANAYAPSLDQIDAGKGYTTENVQIVAWWYNAAKGNWFTDGEARAKFGK